MIWSIALTKYMCGQIIKISLTFISFKKQDKSLKWCEGYSLVKVAQQSFSSREQWEPDPVGELFVFPVKWRKAEEYDDLWVTGAPCIQGLTQTAHRKTDVFWWDCLCGRCSSDEGRGSYSRMADPNSSQQSLDGIDVF